MKWWTKVANMDADASQFEEDDQAGGGGKGGPRRSPAMLKVTVLSPRADTAKV